MKSDSHFKQEIQNKRPLFEDHLLLNTYIDPNLFDSHQMQNQLLMASIPEEHLKSEISKK